MFALSLISCLLLFFDAVLSMLLSCHVTPLFAPLPVDFSLARLRAAMPPYAFEICHFAMFPPLRCRCRYATLLMPADTRFTLRFFFASSYHYLTFTMPLSPLSSPPPPLIFVCRRHAAHCHTRMRHAAHALFFRLIICFHDAYRRYLDADAYCLRRHMLFTLIA